MGGARFEFQPEATKTDEPAGKPLEAAPPEQDSHELAKKLQNPIANLISVPFQFNYDLAMRQGAEDFLTKRAPREDPVGAIERALGRDALLRAQRAKLRALRAPFDSLTPREREVLAHVLSGRLNKQIAGDLGVDERSIKRHRTSIMGKLRVASVAELTHLVHEAGLEFSPPQSPPLRH